MVGDALSSVRLFQLSVALAREYRAVGRHPAQRMDSGLSEADADTVVTALCAVAEPAATGSLWRP